MPDRSTLEHKWVNAYLAYLATDQLPVDPARAQKIAELEEHIEHEDVLTRKLVLYSELDGLQAGITRAELEQKFKDYGRTYQERMQVTYSAWRRMGVPPRMLAAIGVKGASTHSHGGREPRIRQDGEIDGRALKKRNKRTPEFANEVFATWLQGGREAVCERWGYRDVHAVTGVLADLSIRYPDAAAAHGYVHDEQVAKHLADAQATRLAALRQRQAS